jgi:hypothetical protein
MAGLNSPDEGGFRQTQRTPASRLLQQKENMLFLREDWDWDWVEKIREKPNDFGKNSKLHRFRLAADFGKSNTTTQSSSATSDAIEPPRLTSDMKMPNTSLAALGDFNLPVDFVEETFGDILDGDPELPDALQPEPKLSSSLETGVEVIPIESHHFQFPVRSGPMDRFLSNDDALAGPSDQPRFGQDWEKLRALRVTALRVRSQLKTKRIELREKQLAKSAADEAFIRYAREHRAVPLSERIFDTYYSAMQSTRDDYGPMEDDYDQLENFLDETEFEMAKIEGRIHSDKINITQQIPDPDSAREGINNAPPSGPMSFLGLTSGSEDYHPLYEKYLSRLGDLDLAKEKSQNMRRERESLLAEQESRSRLGLELHENLKSFLEELPLREAEVKGEITAIEVDVERLKMECLAAGIDVEESDDGSEYSTNSVEPPHENPISNKIEVMIQDEGTPSEPPRTLSTLSMFPLLLPQTEQGIAALRSLIIKFDQNNKSDRVNRWLLFSLRTTPLEVALLVRVFLQCLHMLDIRHWNFDRSRWERYVLQLWDKDGANKSAEVFRTFQAHSSPTQSQSHDSLTLKGRPHARSIMSSKAPSFTPPRLRASKSAPGSLDLGRKSNSYEVLEVFGF